MKCFREPHESGDARLFMAKRVFVSGNLIGDGFHKIFLPVSRKRD